MRTLQSKGVSMRLRYIFTILLFITTTPIFGAPVKNNIEELIGKTCEKSSLPSDFVDKFISTDGIRIHYIGKNLSKTTRVQGKPTLLFIPGLSMPAWIWEKQLTHFAKNYTTVAMDPRSQGESSITSEGMYTDSRAKDIKSLVDQLNLKPVVLIGWSFAVSEIASYIDQFGLDDIAGIVFVSGSPGFTPEVLGPHYQEQIRILCEKMQKCRITTTCNFVKSLFATPQSDEYLEKITRSALRMPTNNFISLITTSKDYRHVLPKITKPTLIFVEACEDMSVEQKMHTLISNSRLEIIEKANHALFVDQPDTFNALLESFLQSL